ncbi:ATP-binding domain-containing protein [Haloferula sp. BvORR071]|uniref:ATP-binding domain-containing protein n=1 Tax=Haloferula sp. BvORR071 TaxID=1396141 RepID=UPI000697823A|nr:ATP-binding domain-containing protein [Haloferula sp. BvORR071]
MQGTWWRNFDQLDKDQQKFAVLSPDGKYIISGPPGCGKTNLLLLRGKFTVRSQLHNILFITYANCLADFIRSGIGSYFESDQVVTYWKWARQHIRNYYPEALPEYSALFDLEDDAEKRAGLVRLLRRTYERLPSPILYDAILIDEAQDLSIDEIEEIARLSPRVTIAGDRRQGVYLQNGMGVEGYTPVKIRYHYRIGLRICEVADKLLAPPAGEPTLKDFCRYSIEPYGEAEAESFEHATPEAQYEEVIERLSRQLRTYRNELLGVFFTKNEFLSDFRNYLSGNQLLEQIAFHDLNESDHTFTSTKPIHAMTIHGSKGAEFRAVHIVRGETLKFPFNHRELIFTAVTRAKTSLSLHYTNKLSPFIKTAFATPTTPNPDDLFDE